MFFVVLYQDLGLHSILQAQFKSRAVVAVRHLELNFLVICCFGSVTKTSSES